MKTRIVEEIDDTQDQILEELRQMNIRQDRMLRALEDLVNLMGRSQISPG